MEDCSLIRSGDVIQPYFSISVANDPDITSILFFLLDSDGELTGEEVIYPLLNNEIPAFSLPKGLKMGYYSLIFEPLSEVMRLSRSDIEFFYIGNIKFSLNDIKVYLPSVSSSQLIAPGTNVLLEAELDFDNILDPYIIWYNDKNIIEQGKYKDGLNRILLTMPLQTGFNMFKLEVFPYRLMHSLNGITRSITLAVSPKAVDSGYFFSEGPNFEPQNLLSTGTAYLEQFTLVSSLIEKYGNKEDANLPDLPLPPVLLQWYQFKGNLYETVEPFNKESLEPLDTETRWSPAGKRYGLSVGKGDAYALPPVLVKEKDKNDGGGLFLFLIKPIDEGNIFSAFFPSQLSPNEGVWMEMSRKGYDLVLKLSTMYGKTEMPLYCTSVYYNPVPVIVEFYISQDSFEAKLSLQDTYIQSIIGNIRLLSELSGECQIKLDGGPLDVDNAGLKQEPVFKNIDTEDDDIPDYSEIESENNVFEEKIIKYPSYTVWCEFAVLYSAMPLIKENDFFVEEIENEENIDGEELEEDNEDKKEEDEILIDEETEIKTEETEIKTEETEIKIIETVDNKKEDQKLDEISPSDKAINIGSGSIEIEEAEPEIKNEEIIDIIEEPVIITELDVDFSAVSP